MPWYSGPRALRLARLGGYALAASLASAEAAILAVALNPRVDADYRAFYIDRTTTCLNRDSSARYLFGETISFRRDGEKRATGFKVCGWSGPAGDGTHSLGENSRLRLELPGVGTTVVATLELTPVLRPPQFEQRVRFLVNGIVAGEIRLKGPETRMVSFAVPSAALAHGSILDVTLQYPDAMPPNRSASDIYKRAIKLISLRLDEPVARSRATGAPGPRTPIGSAG